MGIKAHVYRRKSEGLVKNNALFWVKNGRKTITDHLNLLKSELDKHVRTANRNEMKVDVADSANSGHAALIDAHFLLHGDAEELSTISDSLSHLTILA